MFSSYFQSEVVFLFWTLFGFLLVGGLAVRFFKPMVILGTCVTGAWSITHALALFLKKIPPPALSARQLSTRQFSMVIGELSQ